MGSGKTTVGPLVAARLGWRFVDVDDVIEAEAGAPIAEIFARQGEAEFRERERGTIERLAAGDGLVLALGGGAIETAATRELLLTAPGTMLVHLEVELATTLTRCGGTEQTRPSWPTRPTWPAAMSAGCRYTGWRMYRSAWTSWSRLRLRRRFCGLRGRETFGAASEQRAMRDLRRGSRNHPRHDLGEVFPALRVEGPSTAGGEELDHRLGMTVAGRCGRMRVMGTPPMLRGRRADAGAVKRSS